MWRWRKFRIRPVSLRHSICLARLVAARKSEAKKKEGRAIKMKRASARRSNAISASRRASSVGDGRKAKYQRALFASVKRREMKLLQ